MPAAVASLQRAEAERRRLLLDVSEYVVALDLSAPTTGDLTAPNPTFGSVTTIRLSSGAGRTFVNVLPVALHAVHLDGRPLDVDQLDAGRFPLDLDAGDHELVVEATMGFRDDGEGLHLAHDPADGRAYVYGMSFMDAAPSWFACFDQPDLKATYTAAGERAAGLDGVRQRPRGRHRARDHPARPDSADLDLRRHPGRRPLARAALRAPTGSRSACRPGRAWRRCSTATPTTCSPSPGSPSTTCTAGSASATRSGTTTRPSCRGSTPGRWRTRAASPCARATCRSVGSPVAR